MPHIANSFAAASSMDDPSRERITTTAISIPVVRSNAPIVSFRRETVSARRAPARSVTHVPFCTRGFGMLASGSLRAPSNTGIIVNTMSAADVASRLG